MKEIFFFIKSKTDYSKSQTYIIGKKVMHQCVNLEMINNQSLWCSKTCRIFWWCDLNKFKHVLLYTLIKVLTAELTLTSSNDLDDPNYHSNCTCLAVADNFTYLSFSCGDIQGIEICMQWTDANCFLKTQTFGIC